MSGNNNQRNQAFKRASSNIVNSGWVIPATLVFSALFIVCIRFVIQDIRYSMWGYSQFPTSDATSGMGLYVALFFPLLQMSSVYMMAALGFDRDKSNDKWIWVFAAIAVGAFLFDTGTDLFYLLRNSVEPMSVATALFDTFVVLWFASEVMLTISFAMLLVLVRPFFREVMHLLRGHGGNRSNRNQHQQKNRPVSQSELDMLRSPINKKPPVPGARRKM